jgi:hypothetical protein
MTREQQKELSIEYDKEKLEIERKYQEMHRNALKSLQSKCDHKIGEETQFKPMFECEETKIKWNPIRCLICGLSERVFKEGK